MFLLTTKGALQLLPCRSLAVLNSSCGFRRMAPGRLTCAVFHDEENVGRQGTFPDGIEVATRPQLRRSN